MIKEFIKNTNNIGNYAGLFVKKYSPEIKSVLGIGFMLGGTATACGAALKIRDILEEHKEIKATIDDIKEMSDNGELETEITEEDISKDKKNLAINTALRIAGAAAVPVTLETVGAVSILSGCHDARKMYNGISSTLAMTTATMLAMKENIRERYGDEVANEVALGIREQTVTETITDAKGKEKTVEKKIKVYPDITINKFARLYELKDYEENSYILSRFRMLEDSINDILETKGYIVANDILPEFNFETCAEGMYMGIVNDPSITHQFSLGLNDPVNKRFIEGYEPSVWLNFNFTDNVLEWKKTIENREGVRLERY